MSRYSVKTFGATGNGTTDDTAAFEAALRQAHMQNGGTIFIEAGTYRIKRPLDVKTSRLSIIGEGKQSVILYDYTQKPSDTPNTASLFIFEEGIEKILVKDLKLEYQGLFYPNFYESYYGKINGLSFRLCSDVSIENIEVCGFNANAISLLTKDPNKIAQRFRVHACHLHHNRVAGVLYGYVNGISITDCDLTHHGAVPDGGTGYGCAGSSGEWPTNIQIIGNRACYNYRKGIDLHAGTNAIIEGNICHANRLYGIYTVGRKTGNIVIRGNIISGMGRKNVGLPYPYGWITGIDIGPYADRLQQDDYHNYLVEGNQILDFGLDEGAAYPIRCYYRFHKGLVQIKNNLIRASRISFLIGFTTPNDEADRQVMVDIDGNQAFVEQVRGPALVLPAIRDLSIHGNAFDMKRTDSDQALIDFQKRAPKTLHLTYNRVYAPHHFSLIGDPSENLPACYSTGNTMNGHFVNNT